MSKTELVQRALELPEDERAELASLLLDTLNGAEMDAEPMSAEWRAAWGAEIERRLREIDTGQVELQDWKEALAEIKESLQKERRHETSHPS